MYKSLSLLSNLFNKAFSTITIPCYKTLNQLCGISFTFGAIRFFNVIELSAYVCLPLLGLVSTLVDEILTTKMSNIYEQSVVFVKRQKGIEVEVERRDCMHNSKILRSLRPMRYEFGTAFVFTKQTKLTVLELFISNIIFLLVTF